MPAFSAKVQAIAKQTMSLQQQKEVLTRQIQQQRELNASSDEVKDKKIADMSEEVRSLRNQLEVTEQEAKVHLESLEKHGKAAASLDEARNNASVHEANAEALMNNLDTRTAELTKAESNVQHLEGEVVRLQTELTMVKAELDGAYGSRAQRKAEAAADPALTARVSNLEKELSETIADYEAMTKATIEHEKEREGLEGTIDGLREQVEKLEAQLSEEKIGLLSAGGLGNRTPLTPNTEGGRGGTSAGVLKAEFKKMMRETRAEHTKRLREEQEERRKVEALLRALKKEQLSKAGAQTAVSA